MNSERSLIASVVLLGVGLGLILGYCHDSTINFSGAHPVVGASFQAVINTNGWPAMMGFGAILMGAVLLAVAFVQAIVGQVLSHESSERGRLPV